MVAGCGGLEVAAVVFGLVGLVVVAATVGLVDEEAAVDRGAAVVELVPDAAGESGSPAVRDAARDEHPAATRQTAATATVDRHVPWCCSRHDDRILPLPAEDPRKSFLYPSPTARSPFQCSAEGEPLVDREFAAEDARPAAGHQGGGDAGESAGRLRIGVCGAYRSSFVTPDPKTRVERNLP